MKTLLVATALALAMSFSPASAQSCKLHDELHADIKDAYNEIPVGTGITGRGSMVELLLDREDNSWSLTETFPSGETCYRGGGESWEFLPVPGPDLSSYPPA